MEPTKLEKTDVELMGRVFFERIRGEDMLMALETSQALTGVFCETLKDCLFDNTELLEQLRLEGEADPWR